MIKELFKLASLSFLFMAGAVSLWAQPDPVLFTIKNNPVYLSEFRQIYAKTNQEKADFSEASLREYLDLYIKFKLKVQRGRELQLDTTPAFKTEFEGYRRQLAASYLVDKEVSGKLVREAYERMQQDADISHIFIACDKNAKPADTLRAWNRAMNLYKMLQSGTPFEQLARDSSEDKSAKENNGRLGFVTAMLPDGYYHMETAIYSAKPGETLPPVRSNSGYHVLRVHQFRPARGEVEIAHILLRKGKTGEENTRKRLLADSVYTALKSGSDWDLLCSGVSEDKMSAAKGGNIGFFGINRYQFAFEEAAFALQNDGDISTPVETSVGWHILKRIGRKGVENFEKVQRPLEEKIKRDNRIEVAKQSMIARIRTEGNFQEYPETLAKWTAGQVDSIFLTYRWSPDPAKPQTPLQRYGDAQTYTLADFEAYCLRASRDRMRGFGQPLQETVDRLYKIWSEEAALHFEESQLEKKHPEYRSLVREYREGMLMFDAANLEVRDRASADSAGLERFFQQNLADKYKWSERARVSVYTLKSDDPELLLKVRDYAAQNPSEEVLKKFNAQETVLTVSEKTFEKGKNKDLNFVWKPGGMTNAKTDNVTKTVVFSKVEEIIPPAPKTLDEARGYALADYQDYLEKQWLEKLKAQYTVKIDEVVFKSLIKKP